MPDPPEPDPHALARLATDAALAAGELLRAGLGEPRRVVATKSSITDLVTEYDRRAEELIVSILIGERPHDAVLGEEGGERSGTSGVRWIIDPLDGTTNYLYGHPLFAVSIAAEVDGRAVAGVVHAPTSGETFTAVAGSGARLDGHEITANDLDASTPDALGRALVGTGFGYDAARRAAQARVLPGLLPAVRDIRRGGAAALDLCWVGCGRLDGFYELGLAPWDLAAGALVATEAGAVVEVLGPDDAVPDLAVAAGPGLFPALRALVVEGHAAELFPEHARRDRSG